MRLRHIAMFLAILIMHGLAPGSLWADSVEWSFTTPSKYHISDSSAVEVDGGLAQLIQRDQRDDDDSSAGFGGGSKLGVEWQATDAGLVLHGEVGLALPEQSVATGWTDMTDNRLLLHLEEPIGASFFADVSSSALALTCTHCPTTQSPGKLAKAISCDGNNHVLLADPFVVMPTHALTVTFWIQTSNTSKAGTPLSYAVTGADNEFLIYDYRNLRIYRGTDSTGATGVALNDGFWHHVAVTWRSSDGRVVIYKDGVQAYQGAIGGGSPIAAGGSLALCQEQDSVGGGFDVAQAMLGSLDEVAMFGRILTPEEIATHYARQSPLRSGLFTSRVFDATGPAAWDAMAWVSSAPTHKPLPNDQLSETAYGDNNVAMTGNQLLFHADDLSTTIIDSSSLGNHGTYTGALNGQDGRLHSALGFDGVNDAVTIPHHASLNMTTALTMAAWVYPEKFHTGNSAILSKGKNGSATYRLKFRGKASSTGECDNTFADANMRAEIKVGGTRYIVCWGNLQSMLGSWHHVVATYDGAALQMYWDGQLQATVPVVGALNTNTSALELGTKHYGGGEFFKGRIDEVALFDRALSPAEITAHYLRGATRLDFQVRTCSASDCAGVVWQGTDGTSATAYSELAPGTPPLPTPSLGTLPDARYFQYRTFFASDDLVAGPVLQSVAITPDHYPIDKPTISNQTGPAFTSLTSLSEELGGGNQGTVRYQLSHNGTHWSYFNGAIWSAAATVNDANTITEINAALAQFSADVGSGHFYFKAILEAPNAEEPVALDRLTLVYSAFVPPSVGFGQAASALVESAGTLSIPVALSGPVAEDVTITFDVAGTAIAGVDYVVAASPLTIVAGQSTGSIGVTPLDNDVVDGDRWFVILLHKPANATLGPQFWHQVTMTDDDDASTTPPPIPSPATPEAIDPTEVTVDGGSDLPTDDLFAFGSSGGCTLVLHDRR